MSIGSDNFNLAEDLFAPEDGATRKFMDLLNDPDVSQAKAYGYDKVKYWDNRGPQLADQLFANPEHYIQFLNHLMTYTDAGYDDVSTAKTSFIEGSFLREKTPIAGSIHIATKEVTRDEPHLTVRKQPNTIITLDQMVMQGMLTQDMALFLDHAVRGKSNILVSGGGGAGKTTLTRALCAYIDPWDEIATAEEIDELHLKDRIHGVGAMTTYRLRDQQGIMIRETTLDDLVKEGLRMRVDRILVGETRGKEAFALVKACNSGHDGSITTVHADNPKQAIEQLTTYVMESGLPEMPARTQVARAFHIIVQVERLKLQKRVISAITAVEPVLEGGNAQRMEPLWLYNNETGVHEFVAHRIPARILEHWQRYGVNWDYNPTTVW